MINIHRLFAPFLLGLGMLVAVCAVADKAEAQFIGYYRVTPPSPGLHSAYNGTTFGNWSCAVTGNIGGAFLRPTLDSKSAPEAITLSTGEPANSDPEAEAIVDFTIPNRRPGFYSFDYTLSIGNTYGDVAAIISSTIVPLAVGSGSVKNLYVAGGRQFGFRVQAGPAAIYTNPPMRSYTTLTVHNVSFRPLRRTE